MDGKLIPGMVTPPTTYMVVPMPTAESMKQLTDSAKRIPEALERIAATLIVALERITVALEQIAGGR